MTEKPTSHFYRGEMPEIEPLSLIVYKYKSNVNVCTVFEALRWPSSEEREICLSALLNFLYRLNSADRMERLTRVYIGNEFVET